VEGTSEHQAQEGARRRATSTKGIVCCVLAATVALMGVPITPAIHSLLLSTPPPPKRKNPPKTKTRQFPPKQKHTLLTKQNPQQIQSPPSLFFFFLLLLLRLGHHLHGFNNSRAEVPSKTPATRKANYGRTKYQNLLSTAAEERSRGG